MPYSKGIQELENRTWDWRVRLSVRPGTADPHIRIIQIDQPSIDKLAQDGNLWPWPRSLYVPIIKFLEKGGAKGLAFDILFTEPSAIGGEEDKILGESLKGSLPVLHIISLSDRERTYQGPELERFNLFKKRQLEQAKTNEISKKYLSQAEVHDYKSATIPILEILENGRYFGNVNADPDSDGILRHYTIGGVVSGIPVLNSPFAFFDMVEGKNFNSMDLSRFLDSENRLAVHFHEGAGAYSPISFTDILSSFVDIESGIKPHIDPSEFKDAWVYLGVSALGLFDLKPTPLNERGKAVEFLATTLDNIIHRDFIIKISPLLNQLFTLLFVIVISQIVFYTSSHQRQVVLVTTTVIILILSTYAFALWGYWIHFLIPFTTTVFSLLLALAFQFLLEGRQSRFIKEAFRFYVSPTVVEDILNDPLSLELGGERRELTMFFSDIVGFTSIAEKIEPTKLVALINAFLTEMTNIIQASGGTVDKYVGDAIVAFWNAPLAIPDHAQRAVKVALDCQNRLFELKEFFKKEFGVELAMRVGINTGIVTVGNFGSKDRFSYTMIGDEVNLASRLEGANKYFGTHTLISNTTKEAIGDLIFSRKIADIRVVGKTEIVGVYEPMFQATGLGIENIRIFEAAMIQYESGKLQDALEAFRKIPNDAVARVYITRIERDLHKGIDKNWSPVWNLADK